MADHPGASATQERAVLPRDIAVFLPLLGIGLHKCTAYPPGHPLLKSALDAVASHLRIVLVNRPFLLLGVARGQLLVEGLATDPGNPVLRDLATKLHKHQLGAIKVFNGVDREQVEELLKELSQDPRQKTIGRDLTEYDTRWEHIRLIPPAYDRLELSDSDQKLGDTAPTESAASRLWVGLAAVAVAREGAPELHTDPRAIAQALNQRVRDPAEAKKIIDYLLGLSRELRRSHGQEADVLKERLGMLLNHITPEALRELATLGADLAQRRRLVMDAAMVLPAGAVLTLMRAVSDASSQVMPQAIGLGSEFTGGVRDYAKIAAGFRERVLPDYPLHRGLMLAWDNTARRGNAADISVNFTVEAYHGWLRTMLQSTREAFAGERRILFVNAWNEWSEGSYLEPDQLYGHACLEATRAALLDEPWIAPVAAGSEPAVAAVARRNRAASCGSFPFR